MARRSWKYNEESDEFVEVLPKPDPARPDETPEQRKRREEQEKAEHPGQYL